MSDYVTVANLAMSKLGEDDQIRDPDQDSHAARSIRAVWVPLRKAVLRAGKFNFSMTRAELTAQASTSPGYQSPYPFDNRFPVPADFLRLVEIIEPAEIADAYKFERKAVLADTDGPVFVRYVADIEDPTEWDDLFAEAFSARIAFQVADRITGSTARQAACWAMYRAAIKLSAGVDAQEDPPIETDDSSWITARTGGASGCE